jgi:putative NADH-flavin reductase
MKIAVVGATGATGRRVVKHALAQGHFVTAIARHPDRLASADRLSFVPGDVLAPAGLASALDGADAAISCIGPEKTFSPGERSCQSVSPAFSPNANVRTSGDSYCKVVSA